MLFQHDTDKQVLKVIGLAPGLMALWRFADAKKFKS